MNYDVIIIGAGAAGLSAGMYCGRFGLKTLIFGEQPGGLITSTHLVENYPGILSISGPDMGQAFIEHAQKFGAEIKYDTVRDIGRRNSDRAYQDFIVWTGSGEYISRALILAMGTDRRKLGVKGEAELSGRGISYCAFCDAAFFKDKIVGVVGGGDSASEESLVLAGHAKKVYLFVRDVNLKGEPVLIKQVKANPKIEMRVKTEVAEILGEEKVSGVKLKSGETVALDGLFIAVGQIPKSDLVKHLAVELTPYGYIKISRDARTNIPGIFAAGDVTDGHFKQAVIAACEGVYAAYGAYKYLQN